MSKWVKMTQEEVVENCSDILRALWHDGSVEPYLERFFKNKND